HRCRPLGRRRPLLLADHGRPLQRERRHRRRVPVLATAVGRAAARSAVRPATPGTGSSPGLSAAEDGTGGGGGPDRFTGPRPSRSARRPETAALAATAAASSRATTTNMARRSPACSPRRPSSGGPTGKARYPLVATALTRSAPRSGSSPAAEIATGNPSDAPSPHSTTATPATTGWDASAATVTPTAPHSALADSTAARPNRTRTGPPANRPTVIATAKPA